MHRSQPSKSKHDTSLRETALRFMFHYELAGTANVDTRLVEARKIYKYLKGE